MIAILCPGQSAQSPGFLSPWAGIDVVAEMMRALSTRAYVDLLETGCDETADVVDTAVAQPLVVAAGVATARLLGPLPSDCVIVGHSVGELTAACLAGALTPAAAVDIARERGRAMARASAAQPSGMVALLGGDRGTVEAAVIRAGAWVANHNGAGQVVAAGPAAALDRLVAEVVPPTRLRSLAVSGAFHTPLMEPARATVHDYLFDLRPDPMTRRVVSNADGAVVDDPAELLRRLVAQITAPVRFDACIETLRGLGITATIEVAPAAVLTGLVRRALPDVTAVALRTDDDLDAAHALLAAHASGGEQWTEDWGVVVAPATGVLRLPEQDEGATAVVANRSGDVALAGDLRVLEWLARDGDPVREGQPLARVAAP